MAYPIETFGSAPFEIIDGDRGKAYPKGSEFRPSGYCLFLSATNWLGGFDGCYSYGGRSEEGAPVFDADGKFSAPPIGRTEQGCVEPEGVLDRAEAYISTLMRMERFRVSGDRLVTGVTACRAYLASYQGTEGSVRFPSNFMLTYTHSCPEDAWRMEGEFGDFLTWAREYAVSEEEGSRLLRMRSSRGKTLTFEPLSPTVKDIADAEWTLVAFVEIRELDSGTWNPRTTRVVQGTDVTISFDEDGLSGSSGCNSYTGQTTDEDAAATIDVQAFSHTEKVCEGLDGLMEQEERFLDLLPRLERYGTYGDGLFLQIDNQVFLLFEAK